MIRIAISQAAFEAIANTLMLGSVGFENQVDANGQRLIWLAPRGGRPAALPARARRDLYRCHPAAGGGRG
jgi:hypothetical protein